MSHESTPNREKFTTETSPQNHDNRDGHGKNHAANPASVTTLANLIPKKVDPPFQRAARLQPYFDLANSTLGGITTATQEVARSSSLASLSVLAAENPDGCMAFAQLCNAIFTAMNRYPEWQRVRALQQLGPLTGLVLDFKDWGTKPVLNLKYTPEGRVEAGVDDDVLRLLAALNGTEFARVRVCPAHRLDGRICGKFFYARRLRTDACSPTCQATTRQARRREREPGYNQSKKESLYLASLSREGPTAPPKPGPKR